jgi:flagellar hook-associated protein 3 FlgL
MRVTQSLNATQFLTALDTLESNLSQTQNEISTGLAFTTPAQNPVAAGSVDNYNQALAASQQYTTNANGAQSSLNIEDNAMTQVQSQLQTLRDLALEANSGTVSNQNLSAIATQASQIQSTLLSLANTQDGNGNYIFAGYATQTQPFAATPTGASYAGDQGQRLVQIAAGQTVAVGDSGDAVFNQIKTGNGTFTVTAAPANTGTGLIGASTVTDAANYDGGTYSITFGAGGTYQVLNAQNAVVTSGTYTAGQSIGFRGIQVTISGQPASGDSFTVAPSTSQSLFTTVQNLVTTLQAGASGTNGQTALSNSLSDSINNLDQALTQASTVQSGIGSRLNSITTQLSLASSQQIQLQQSISNLQSLDYPSAITTLDNENTTLSAAMQAYTLTQGLSLFKYIQ